MPKEKYVEYESFPTHRRLSLFHECSAKIKRKSGKSAYAIYSFKVDISSQNQMRDFSLLMFVNNSRHTRLEDYLALWNGKPTEQQDLDPWVNYNGSGFTGKSIALQHVFSLAVALKEGREGGGPNTISQEIAFFKSLLKCLNPSLCCSNWNPIPIFLLFFFHESQSQCTKSHFPASKKGKSSSHFTPSRTFWRGRH